LNKIKYYSEDFLGWLVINNPHKKNALDYEMWFQIPEVVNLLNDDNNIRVIIIKGEGDNFSSGADMSQFDDLRSGGNAALVYNRAIEKAYLSIKKAGKPVIAMIQGYCVGGGCGLALQADLRIAGTSAKFGIPAAKRGVGYNFQGVKDLIDIVGVSYARDILYTGKTYPADDALQMGLINHCVKDSELLEFTKEYGQTIAENAPLTIRAVKLAINEYLQSFEVRDIEKVNEAVQDCFRSRDYREGYQAFLEKRKPKFQGN
jgi:enoyl-CoA hydratase/carnithine racemase